MNFRGYRLHVVALACAVVVVLGLGVRHIVYSRHVVAPLERDFAAIEGVADATVTQRSGQTDIVLTVEPVDDLPRLYKEAETLREQRLADSSARIIIKDRRTAELVDVWRQIQFAVYEGAVTGRFTAMAANVEQIAAALPSADVDIAMDDELIYVHLADGDAYLYELVPWTTHRVDDGLKGDGQG